MGRRERRKRRRERKERQSREWVNTDPLQWYNTAGEPLTGHPLRNLWRGKSGFLVCGGPSINDVDYMRLGERGVASLAVNNVSGYVPVSAMTFSDPPEKFHYGVLYDPRIMKLVPRQKLGQTVRLKHPETKKFIKTDVMVKELPSVFVYDRSQAFVAEEFLTSTAAMWGNNKRGVRKTKGPKTLNTMLLGVRLMHYLGCRRVYLLGVDFGMEGKERQQGNYAFNQAGSPGGNNNAYKVLTNWFTELKPQFDAEGFEFYNCNPRSRLTLFPHVPFAHALEDCRAPVPPEPFDLEGWYEKGEDKKKKDDDYDPDA